VADFIGELEALDQAIANLQITGILLATRPPSSRRWMARSNEVMVGCSLFIVPLLKNRAAADYIHVGTRFVRRDPQRF